MIQTRSRNRLRNSSPVGGMKQSARRRPQESYQRRNEVRHAEAVLENEPGWSIAVIIAFALAVAITSTWTASTMPS